jgi:hypothetical protein
MENIKSVIPGDDNKNRRWIEDGGKVAEHP